MENFKGKLKKTWGDLWHQTEAIGMGAHPAPGFLLTGTLAFGDLWGHYFILDPKKIIKRAK